MIFDLIRDGSSRVMRLVGSSKRFMDAEPVVDAYARAAFDDLKRSVGALRELVAPLAGLPGRKALLYVSDGIPMVAGTDLFRLLDMRFSDSARGNLLALRYSARNDFRRLTIAASAGLIDGPLHRPGNSVCVQNSRAIQIPRRTPDGLNQRALRAQEAFLVRIQDRHERDLRHVQPLSQ